MDKVIDKENWYTCKICNTDIKELAKVYGGGNIYYNTVFFNHLGYDHNIQIEEYLREYCDIEQPVCSCGRDNCQKLIKIKRKGNSKIQWKELACGYYEETKRWSEWAREGRKGAGNPMYGKECWSKGHTKDTHPSLKAMSEKLLAKEFIMTEEKRQRFSRMGKKSKGHTGKHHSPETKEFLRQNTLRLISEGVFEQNRTKPFIAMESLLEEIGIDFEEEKKVFRWSIDFYIPSKDIYIEVDGDYFHSNPKFYPDGPESVTQKNNFERDIAKNTFFEKSGLMFVRFWEDDILNRREEVKCKLLELLK